MPKIYSWSVLSPNLGSKEEKRCGITIHHLALQGITIKLHNIIMDESKARKCTLKAQKKAADTEDPFGQDFVSSGKASSQSAKQMIPNTSCPAKALGRLGNYSL